MSAPAAALQGLQAGMEAPGFALKAANGETGTLAGLKGDRLTVIVFWSTWSKKSPQVLARMQQLYEKYRGRGISIIGVNSEGPDSSGKTLAEIAAFQAKFNITFPMLTDPGLVAFRQYGVIALPTTVILRKDMTIAYELPGYPATQSEAMIQFIVSTAEGKEEPLPPGKATYRPNEKAVRFFNMGTATLKSKRTSDTAESWFHKAAEADSQFILPHLSLAELYLQRGSTTMALKEFNEVLARDPENVIALCESGLMLVHEEKGPEALVRFERARKMHESYAPAYYYAAYAYGKEGRMDDAMRMFDEAEKANPLDYRLFYFKGDVYEGHRDVRNAFSAYQKALEIILGST